MRFLVIVIVVRLFGGEKIVIRKGLLFGVFCLFDGKLGMLFIETRKR